MAVSGLKNLGGDEDLALSSKFDRILSKDLLLSGYYTLVDPHTFIEDPRDSGCWRTTFSEDHQAADGRPAFRFLTLERA